MSTTNNQSNLTSGFTDLATYDELEKYMYGGCESYTYFVRETRKSTWFTQVPVQLAKCEGIADFGQNWSVTISRSGDYLLGTWLHVAVPAVSVAGWHGRSVCIAWTPNFMHALIKNCCITFNDLVAAKFDGTHLDFWAAFTTPASKAEGYRQMIGSQIPTCGGYIPSQQLSLPLPFFFTRDSGVALPTAALPYNEMRINLEFRKWEELLVGFAPKVECFNYAVGSVGGTQINNVPIPYIIPQNNSSVTGIQPCWNTDIWPSCTPITSSTCVPSAPTAQQPQPNGNFTERTGYNISDEMSFILLPPLNGPPSSRLSTVGTNEYSQSSDQTNFDARNFYGAYVGTPSGLSNGVFCNIKEPSLVAQVWANYAIVSNEERAKLACAPRDILIEQVQTTPDVDFCIRNKPDTQWWPNNISTLTTPTTGLSPEPVQAPSGTTGMTAPSPSSSNVPDNEIPCGEINWPAADNNMLAQQPSKQGYCLDTSLREAAQSVNGVQGPFRPPVAGGGWSVNDTADTSRHQDCDDYGSVVKMNLKFAYSIKTLFYGVRNVTATNIHSNYTIGFPVLQASASDLVTLDGPVFSKDVWDAYAPASWPAIGTRTPYYKPYESGGIAKYVGKIQNVPQSVITCKNGFDPIESSNMLYDTQARLGYLDASYYSLEQPYYHAPAIPSSSSPVFCPSGYHMYSYSLDFNCLDPMGSTNYGKLTSVSIQAQPIKLSNSSSCPYLSYAVPPVNSGGTDRVDPGYVFGPINGPGLVGDGAKSLKNQSVLEVLINMAYQNIYHESGLETITPWLAGRDDMVNRSTCCYLGKYKFVATAINNNILRISGGSVGFPVL